MAKPVIHAQVRVRMGTLMEIRLWNSSAEKARAACDRAFARIQRLESIFTRFDPRSEVRRLVEETPGRRVRVSADLFRILSLARGISEASRGAFDITAGRWTALWEAAERAGTLPTRRAWKEARRHVGWEKLHLDPAAGAVELEIPGMALDLGAVGKGYAVDRAVEILQSEGIPAGLVDAGGNFKIFGFTELQQAGIEDPCRPDRLWGTVDLVCPAVSTSSNARRGFRIQGKTYGHLIDPRTGCPLKSHAGATVLAESAAVADALSTALLVLGPSGMNLLPEYHAEGLLQPDWISPGLNGHVHSLQLKGIPS